MSSNSQGKFKRFYKKYSLLSTSQKNKNVALPKMPSNPQEEGSTSKAKPGGREVVIVDEKNEVMFSDYIRNVKDRMTKAASNVGAGKKTTRRDSLNDNFSHFISRAKSRFRKHE